MGLFGGSKNEHHDTPCPKGATPRNRMGWGNDKPRRLAGKQLKMHGSRAGKRLMSGKGGLIKQDAKRWKVTGEKPRGRGRK